MTDDPNNRSQYLEAQAGVIGSLLIDAKRVAGDIMLRTNEAQYTGQYKTIYTAARQLHQEGKPIDPLTIGAIVGPDYREFMLQLMDITPTAVNCGAYVDLLIEQSQVAKMQALGLALAGIHSQDEAAKLLEDANHSLIQRPSLKIVSAKDGHLNFMIRQGEKAEYIPWGLRKIDDAILSVPGDLVIIGGRPSSGKTALSLQMAWEQSKTKKVGYFSLETRPDEVYDRLHAMAAKVDSTRIRNHRIQQDEATRIAAAEEAFASRSLDVISDASVTVSDIRSIAVARGYDVIYVDYLQIVNPGQASRPGDRFWTVSQISMDLHRLAVSLGVLVVALSQLSRPEKASRSKAPDLYSLRESGQIEQDADAVMLLYRTDEDDNTSIRRLRIAKNKKGLTGGYIDLDFDGPTQTFSESHTDVARQLNAVGQAAKAKARNPIQDFEVLTGQEKLPF